MKSRTLSVVLIVALALGASSFAQVKKPPTLEREHYNYYFDKAAFVAVADSALDRARVRLSELVRHELSYKPAVYIPETDAEFGRLTRGVLPDWGVAVAFPQRKLIAIKSPDKFNVNRSLSELLAHEYAHLVTDERTGFHHPPRWFNEGLSMYVSMEWGWSDNLAMSKAAVFGQLIPLADIELVNRFGEGKAHVAYSQSFLAVKYLFDEYGVNSVNIFLDQIAAGKSANHALIESTGSSYSEFDKEFIKFLQKQYNVSSLFMDTFFFWIGLALIVVVGTFLRYRKRRQVFKKWEREEKFQSTDFDYGDPDHPERTDDDEPWRS
jgi:hypothetical protein